MYRHQYHCYQQHHPSFQYQHHHRRAFTERRRKKQKKTLLRMELIYKKTSNKKTITVNHSFIHIFFVFSFVNRVFFISFTLPLLLGRLFRWKKNFAFHFSQCLWSTKVNLIISISNGEIFLLPCSAHKFMVKKNSFDPLFQLIEVFVPNDWMK